MQSNNICVYVCMYVRIYHLRHKDYVHVQSVSLVTFLLQCPCPVCKLGDVFTAMLMHMTNQVRLSVMPQTACFDDRPHYKGFDDGLQYRGHMMQSL